MQEIADHLSSVDLDADMVGNLHIPERYKGAVVLRKDAEMFSGLPPQSRDPAKSLTLSEVPTPEPGVGEVLVAVMASSINYNTVWSSIFEPVPTFGFLKRYASLVPPAEIDDRPFHVLGSDMSGVVLRIGPGVRRWKAGDKVVAHCLSVELSEADGHDDSMLDPEQRIWGYETNYGGLAQLSLVKANQLMPKPAHLTWEEAAASGWTRRTESCARLLAPSMSPSTNSSGPCSTVRQTSDRWVFEDHHHRYHQTEPLAPSHQQLNGLQGVSTQLEKVAMSPDIGQF